MPDVSFSALRAETLMLMDLDSNKLRMNLGQMGSKTRPGRNRVV